MWLPGPGSRLPGPGFNANTISHPPGDLKISVYKLYILIEPSNLKTETTLKIKYTLKVKEKLEPCQLHIEICKGKVFKNRSALNECFISFLILP